MNEHQIAIYIAPNALECRVLLDGADISSMVRGITVRAHCSEGVSVVLLEVLAHVEISGSPGRLEIRKGDPPCP